jgi:hypothetical protein
MSIDDNIVRTRDGICDLCISELRHKCQEENPSWFTPKRFELKQKFEKDFNQWLNEHAKPEKCLVISTTYCECYGEFDSDEELSYVCKRHLLEIAEELHG